MEEILFCLECKRELVIKGCKCKVCQNCTFDRAVKSDSPVKGCKDCKALLRYPNQQSPDIYAMEVILSILFWIVFSLSFLSLCSYFLIYGSSCLGSLAFGSSIFSLRLDSLAFGSFVSYIGSNISLTLMVLLLGLLGFVYFKVLTIYSWRLRHLFNAEVNQRVRRVLITRKSLKEIFILFGVDVVGNVGAEDEFEPKDYWAYLVLGPILGCSQVIHSEDYLKFALERRAERASERTKDE